MTTTNVEKLEIHVFGASKGESIVIKIPGGGWGVVDCFAGSSSKPESNPVLDFLNKKSVKELEFLCLTHPHDDHFKGMSHLLEAFKVNFFWRFGSLSPTHFFQLIEILQIDSEQTGPYEDLVSAKEFPKIFKMVQDKIKNGELRQKTISVSQQIYPVPFNQESDFQIFGLAPSGNQISIYEREFTNCYDTNGNFIRPMKREYHNLVSVGLLLKYGKTQVILGGDIVREGWKDSVLEFGENNLAADAVKISHHGSNDGYCDGLWENFSKNGKPIAIVTAYASQRLPRKSALEHIQKYTKQIYTTRLESLSTNEFPSIKDTIKDTKAWMALSKKIEILPSDEQTKVGRCSFWFDNNGSLEHKDLSSNAGTIN